MNFYSFESKSSFEVGQTKVYMAFSIECNEGVMLATIAFDFNPHAAYAGRFEETCKLKVSSISCWDKKSNENHKRLKEVDLLKLTDYLNSVRAPNRTFTREHVCDYLITIWPNYFTEEGELK